MLFLTIDSLRPDKLSCYGFRKKTSPNIDKICDEALVFTNAYASAAWTSTSLVSIFSSLHPTTHGIEVRGFVLNRNIKTPVESLSEKGWRTYGQHASGDTIGNLGFYPTQGTIIEFLEKVKNERFFVWYHLRTTHLPYNPPDNYITDFSEGTTANFEKLKPIREKKMIVKGRDTLDLSDEDKKFVEILYEANIKKQDDEIEHIINKMKELGLWEKTIIVITSDHGEELFEHGWIGHASTSLDGNLYNEVLKIPLIVRVPGIKKKYVRDPVSQIDIMPILFGILEIKQDFDTDSEIVDIKFDYKDFRIKKRSSIIFASTSPCGWQCKEEEKWKRIFTIIDGKWKLIHYNYEQNKAKDRFELFYLPDEKENLVSKNKKIFSEMVSKLFEMVSRSKVKYNQNPPEVYTE
ncbi:MAG: sulfatase [Candidatus Calescibacterium sp.]|nr:sulfatase [Candidatus Calescibacterium sp.]